MQNFVENKANDNKIDQDDNEEKKKRRVIKSATDLQRLKLEKLMKNPDKPIVIPETPKEKDYMQTVPSFVRNVMGSSAGAGSGEFHVYRHLRRKEYARQKCIHAKSMREQLDEEYQMKLENNRMEAEAKTAKKRAKRLKKKQRPKKQKVLSKDEKEQEKQNSMDEDEDDNISQKGADENKPDTDSDADPCDKTQLQNDGELACEDVSTISKEENDSNKINPQENVDLNISESTNEIIETKQLDSLLSMSSNETQEAITERATKNVQDKSQIIADHIDES